jgi:hypothetical protein
MRNTCAMVFVAAVMALSASSALAARLCPSGGTPPPGTHVKGGLEVDGVCILNGVTVKSGVIVDATGHLQLQSSTVDGGVGVFPGGELDVNATTLGAGFPTGTSSTINGGIIILNAFDIDIWTARVDGGITLNGTSATSLPKICGNSVNGNSSFSNFVLPGQIGGGTVFGVACGGNIFNGTVSLTNLTASMGGNTIKGDLLCSNAAVIVTAPNTITGTNTCF